MPAKLSQEYLMQLLRYEPDTGNLFWLKRTNSRATLSAPAGYIGPAGYRYVGIDGCAYKVARLAFLFMTGEIPKVVDHINRVRLDDRWCNLRAADHNQNGQNKGMPKSNTSGHVGVYWNKPRSKWYARCRVMGVMYNFGSYDDIELAALVASEARAKYHGEFAND